MSTKAQLFRAKTQRDANPPRPKAPRRPRRDFPVDTSLPGVSATDRRVGGAGTGRRNLTKGSRQEGGPTLESSASGRPSRKSTRKSKGRVKRTTNQALAAVRETRSPKRRATAAKARSKGTSR